jgi:hypothetical protein
LLRRQGSAKPTRQQQIWTQQTLGIQAVTRWFSNHSWSIHLCWWFGPHGAQSKGGLAGSLVCC